MRITSDTICLIAGNVAGPIARVVLSSLERAEEEIPDDFEERIARKAVKLAFAITEEASRVMEEKNER